MPFEKKVAQAGGSEVRYLDSGTGSRAVVMLHGAGGLRVDERVFNALAEEYRLIAPSMPGFDDSTPGAAASVPEVADVMAEFIRQVVGGPAAVIGESFGGNVASWLAIRHPEAVDALVLAAPAGLWGEGGLNLAQASPQEIAVALFGRPPTEPPSPELVERSNRNRANMARLSQPRPRFDPELQEQLAQIKAPTLLLWGTADQLILPKQAQYFQERIPNLRFVSIEGGPHVLSAAAPDQFLPPVLEFLRAPAGVTSSR
jgi:2-hydroxy-6-oxonona-2,4-dienedioate hydrolase/4,5:9,10-diseco-3-hydroxy-5,9,17-trioxoandrosta-1(10),2-diene-4-oate hydrolase